MLTGKIEPKLLDQKLSEYPDYDDNYQVDTISSDKLAQVKEATHLAVIVGTWCPDCHRDIPRLMGVLDSANNSAFTVSYIGVDKNKVDPQGESAAYDFTRLPTYIIMQQGEEIGRITERPQTTLEQDLVKILCQ